MADALTTYQEEKLGRARAVAARAAERLGAARAALAAARADEAHDAAAAALLDAAISATRAAMAGPGLTAGEIEAMAETLRADQIARRKIAAAQSQRTAEIASQAALERTLAGLVMDTAAAAAAAEAELSDARAAALRQAPFMAPETADQLAEIVAAAQLLLDEVGGSPGAPSDPDNDVAGWRALIVAARDRVEETFPVVLRTQARARAAQGPAAIAAAIAGQVARVEDAAAVRLAATGAAGAVAPAALAHMRAEAALATTASGGPRDWNRALNLLATAAASPAPNTDQAAEIAVLALPDGDPALTTELALLDARTVVALAQIDLQSAMLDALLAAPAEDPELHPDVVAAQAALDATRGTPLGDAEAAHTPELAAALDAWEVAVPNAAWTALYNYDTALALLTTLTAGDLAARRAEFDAAEAALVVALLTAETHASAGAVAVAGPHLARARAAALGDLATARSVGALRGDA